MNANQDMADCAKRSRFVSALAGAVVALLLVIFGDWRVLFALIIGIIFAGVVWWLFNKFVCESRAISEAAPADSAPASAAQAVADTPVVKEKTAAAAASAATASEVHVKPSATLPGQTELSAREGEWKYQAPAASAPAAKAKPAKKPAKKPAAKKAAPVADNAGTKPAILNAAREGGPDNLKQIKGVGPKLEALLNTMGFYHFDQIAAWGGDEVAWVDQNLAGFKGRVSRDDWVAQAKILAEGGTTAFSSKVKKGGVY